jgi:radical SAM protein with 4Fe4S-binding SPASM domain
MCWFHGENGIGDQYPNSEMTTAEVLGIITEVAAYKPHIYFGGGEPFIREDFLPILGHVKSFDLPISFTSNGTLLDQGKVQKIVALGIDEINFSIDGYEELHDELRGKGNYSKVTSNMKNIAECKRKQNTRNPSMIVNITVNPLVVGHLQDTICSLREAVGDEVAFYRIHHLWFISADELLSHKAAIQNYLKREASGARAHFIPFSLNIDSQVLADEIYHLKTWKRLDFLPNLRGKEILQFYSGNYRIKKRCMAPFRAALVKPNGDVKFCPDEWIDDYVLGNIREERFENIWNNELSRRFRSILFWKRSFPGCKRCSWMHCF